MKKYVKPELFYEQFELSQHIADCAWELTSSDRGSCSAQADQKYLPGLENLFLSEPMCALIPGVNYGEYCYQDGAQGANVFKS